MKHKTMDFSSLQSQLQSYFYLLNLALYKRRSAVLLRISQNRNQLTDIKLIKSVLWITKQYKVEIIWFVSISADFFVCSPLSHWKERQQFNKSTKQRSGQRLLSSKSAPLDTSIYIKLIEGHDLDHHHHHDGSDTFKQSSFFNSYYTYYQKVFIYLLY